MNRSDKINKAKLAVTAVSKLEEFDKILDKIPEVVTALHLLNSMVLGGEDHSEQSERIYKNAKKIINELIRCANE